MTPSHTHSETSLGFANKDKPSFWLLHCLGWLGYVVIFSFDNILFTHKTDVSFAVIFPLMLSGTLAALLTLPLRFTFRRFWQLSPTRLILSIIACSFVVALIWTPSKNFTMWYFDAIPMMDNSTDAMLTFGDKPWATLTGLSYSFFMILVWSSLYFGINYHFRLIAEKQLHLDAARLSHNAQIKMLRYQINPHFLFNTLNAISTLVLQGKKEKANGMLVRLSTFLRFSLDNDPEKKVPLYDEIKASMLYLEIEKTRFDERLEINLNIEPKAEALLVPSLLLQPLIENSIKYAIANMLSGGKIDIQAYCKDQTLCLFVSDNGPGLSPVQQHKAQDTQTAKSGVGIKNIKDRLAVLYPDAHYFKANSQQDGGYSVQINIPMETT